MYKVLVTDYCEKEKKIKFIIDETKNGVIKKNIEIL